MARRTNRLTYPDYDTPFLEWFAESYQSVFVAFHPFFLINGLHPSACDHRTQIVLAWEHTSEEIQKLVLEPEPPKPDTPPEDFGALIKRKALTVSWASMLARARFSTAADLNRALLTTISALNSDYEDPDGAERLEDCCDRSAVFMPTEGVIQPALEARIGHAFIRLCQNKVWAIDQFGEELGMLETSSLTESASSPIQALRPDHTSLAAPDGAMFLVVDWDSFFMLVAMTEAGAASVRPHELFEGFYADERTTHYWWFENSE